MIKKLRLQRIFTRKRRFFIENILAVCLESKVFEKFIIMSVNPFSTVYKLQKDHVRIVENDLRHGYPVNKMTKKNQRRVVIQDFERNF